jgi:hypothetical protein
MVKIEKTEEESLDKDKKKKKKKRKIFQPGDPEIYRQL